MDPKDNPTNPMPFNGGQAPDSSTPSNPSAAPSQEVTVDFNQNPPTGAQPSAPGMSTPGSFGQAASQPFADPAANPTAPVAAPADPSLGTINDSLRPDLGYNSAPQATSAASAANNGYDSNAAAPSYASPQESYAQPQMPPVGIPTSQPTDFGAPQATAPQQVAPLDPAQNLHEQHPAHALGADKKTIFILAGVAAVLIIAIATLLFL